MINNLRKTLVETLRSVLGFLIISLILLEVTQVLMRYVLSMGVIWGRDVSTLLLFSIAWLGAPLVWLKSQHITVDMFPNFQFGRRLSNLVINLVMVIFAFTLCVFTIRAISVFALIDLPSLGVPAAIKFFPVLTGMILLIVAAVINILMPQGSGETQHD